MRKIRLLQIALLWSSTAAAEPIETVVFELDNFTCVACKLTVEKTLEKSAGVMAKEVDPDAATVREAFDVARTSSEQVAEAITNTGFPATARAQRE